MCNDHKTIIPIDWLWKQRAKSYKKITTATTHTSSTKEIIFSDSDANEQVKVMSPNHEQVTERM